MKELYELTSEHEAQIPAHVEKWKKIILDTSELALEQKELCANAIPKLYQAAELEIPKRLTFVSSPLLLKFAAGTASFLEQNNYAKRELSDFPDFTTHYNLKDAVLSSLGHKVEKDQELNEVEQHEISTGVVCHLDYVEDVKKVLAEFNVPEDKFKDASMHIDSMWISGGCNDAQDDAFITSFQDIAKLDIDYSKYQPWRDLTVAGARIVEQNFAMISEKPTQINSIENDGVSIPHNLHGPAISYRDNSKLYMAYNNFIPSYLVTTPVSRITKDLILKEENADYRRYLIERIGIERYLEIVDAGKPIHTYDSLVGGEYSLLEIEFDGQKGRYLKMKNQSEHVWHVKGVSIECFTVQKAICFRNGMKTFKEPKFLS